jgi:hypothetical protein
MATHNPDDPQRQEFITLMTQLWDDCHGRNDVGKPTCDVADLRDIIKSVHAVRRRGSATFDYLSDTSERVEIC